MKENKDKKSKIKRKLKSLLTPYNIAIFACIVIIIVALCAFILPNKQNEGKTDLSSQTNNSGIRETEKWEPDGPITVVETKTKEGEMISEEDAKNLAIDQFKKLGEKGLKEKDLQLVKILRANEDYYYISSPKNTVEIKVVGGKITRINSILVENLNK